MRYFHFLFLICLLSFPVYAANEGAIISLDEGACWIQKDKDDTWRVVSFNEGRAGHIDEHTLNNFHNQLTHELKSRMENFPQANYSLYVHCSGAGATFIFDFKNSNPNICVDANFAEQGNTFLKLSSIDSNSGREEPIDDYCFGHETGVLLITVKDLSLNGSFIDYLLSNKELNEIFSSIELSEYGTLKLKLKPQFYFKESEARNKLMAAPRLMNIIESIDFNFYARTAGEGYKLLESSYPGFQKDK